MAFDFDRLKTELEDLKTTVTSQTAARVVLTEATLNAAEVAKINADRQATADKTLQDATVASQVADQLVVKQVDFLLALLKQQDPGEDPTPDAPPTTPTTPTV